MWRNTIVIFSPEFVESCLGDAGNAGGHGQEEGGGAQAGVDRHHRRPEWGGGGGAADEEEEGEDTRDELEEEHGHGGESEPGVNAVHVRDGLWLGPGVVVPGSHEAEDDAGDGHQVEHGVDQLAPDPPAAPAGSVDQHGWKDQSEFGSCLPCLTLPHAVDEAGDHEDGVEVPLLLQVSLLRPAEGEGETLGGVPPVLDDPVEGEGQLPVQEDLDQQGQHSEATPGASSHLLVWVHRRLHPATLTVRTELRLLSWPARTDWELYDQIFLFRTWNFVVL